MGLLARVARNLVALTTSLILERAISFVLFLFIARWLGADALGEYALAFSFLAIFETASVFGQNLLVVREVARDRESAAHYLVNSSALVLLVSIASAFVMPHVARSLGYPASTVAYVSLMGLVLIPDSLAVIPESVIQGWERMEYITLFRFLANLAGTALAIVLLVNGGDLTSVLWVIMAQRALLAALYIGWVWRRVRPLKWPNPKVVAGLARISAVFMAMNLFAAIYKNVDVWILRGTGSAAQAGYYSAADRPVQIVGLVAPLVMVAIFPSLTETYRISPERFARILRAGMRGLLLTLPFIAMVITVAAPAFVDLAYGEGYQESVVPLQLLAWSLVPTFLAALLFRAILASNHERVSLRVAFVNMVFNGALNLLLIPHWGAVGASLVALLTPVVGLAQNYWFVERRLVHLEAGKNLLRPAVGVLLSAALFLLLPHSLHLAVRGLLMALAYLIYSFSSGAVSRVEMALIPVLLRDLKRSYRAESHGD